MRKILCLALSAIMCFSMIPATAFAEADSSGDISLTVENFPDDRFRTMLYGKDFGKDGKITREEIKTITKLDVMNQYNDDKIENLKGIEYFTFLKELNFDYNNVSSVDLSKNLLLETLTCSSNQLKELDTSNNYELNYILVIKNQLEKINVKKNPKLRELYCDINNLKEIDISENPKLYALTCGANQLTELDLSGKKELDILECPNNYIRELNLEDQGNMRGLNCAANWLTSLDLTKCPNLFNVSAHCNYLKELDVSGKPYLQSPNWAPKEYKLEERENFNYDDVPSLRNLLENYELYYTYEFEGLTANTENHTISLNEGVNLGRIKLNCETDPENSVEFIFYYGDDMKIDSCDLSGDDAMMNVNESTWKYVVNGEPMDLHPVVKDKAGNLLKEGEDYLITYSHSERVNPEKYTMRINGLNEYRGNKEVTVVITPEPVKGLKVRHSTSSGGYDDAYVTWNKSEGASGYQVYARRPGRTSKWTSLGRTTKTSFLEKDLYDGWRYEFKVIPYVKRDDVRYRTTGDYSTAAMVTLKKAYRPSAKKYNSARVRISWKDIYGESGYQVRASRSGKTTYLRTTGKAMNIKVAKGKKYTYKVRAYKNVTKNGETVRVYGPWSDSRTYTLK